jgi:hypothetical protein
MTDAIANGVVTGAVAGGLLGGLSISAGGQAFGAVFGIAAGGVGIVKGLVSQAQGNSACARLEIMLGLIAILASYTANTNINFTPPDLAPAYATVDSTTMTVVVNGQGVAVGAATAEGGGLLGGLLTLISTNNVGGHTYRDIIVRDSKNPEDLAQLDVVDTRDGGTIFENKTGTDLNTDNPDEITRWTDKLHNQIAKAINKIQMADFLETDDPSGLVPDLKELQSITRFEIRIASRDIILEIDGIEPLVSRLQREFPKFTFRYQMGSQR